MGISLESIRDAIAEVSGVKNIHHLHIWSVGEHDVHAEAHVEVEDMLISKSGELRAQIQQLLSDRFGVGHATLQIECGGCDDEGLVKQGGGH